MPTKVGKALNAIGDAKIASQASCQSCWDKWDALVDSLTNDKDALDDEVSDLLDKIQDYKQEVSMLREALAKWTKRTEIAEEKYAALALVKTQEIENVATEKGRLIYEALKSELQRRGESL